jgi:hypothetical protein
MGTMCRLLREDHGFQVGAMSLEDYLGRRRGVAELLER